MCRKIYFNLSIFALSIFALLFVSNSLAFSQQKKSVNLTPIYTKAKEFSIPFNIQPAQAAMQVPAEVRLHVSLDAGELWQMAGKARPQQKGFTFRAKNDGAFWFALQTIDQLGKPQPANIDQAGLMVIVDTAKPVLKLTTTTGEQGEIVAVWNASDKNLDITSYKLNYQVGIDKKMIPVRITPIIGRQSNQTLSDQTSWFAPQRNEKITVFAQITDKAGNVTTVQQVVQKVVNKVAPKVIEKKPQVQPEVRNAKRPPNRYSANNVTKTPTPGSQKWPATNSHAGPLKKSLSKRNSDLLREVNNGVVAKNVAVENSGVDNNIQKHLTSHPPNSNITNPNSSSQTSFLPPGERPKLVRSKEFLLDYDLKSVGDSGVRRIDLWATLDGGKTWEFLASDPDRKSPIRAKVPSEGLYGLKMAIQNGSGVGGQKPTAGEIPELWIAVDETKPTAKIIQTSIQQQQINITWQASDTKLATRPITLLFSHRPDGPWTIIAASLPNSGAYNWNIGQRLPGRIYFRVEVQDLAGNIGIAQTLKPLDVSLIDTSVPKSNLKTVRPVYRSSSRQSGYRYQ